MIRAAALPFALLLACASRAAAPAAPASATASPSADELLASLRAATSAPPSNSACATAPTLGEAVSHAIEARGDAAPPETGCEAAASGWHCTTTIHGPGAPTPDGDGGPALWLEYQVGADRAIDWASVTCGEQA
ncbi:MAG: hypothetical protein K8W52_03860 [Deltaproteobacteria bacterium]|nr:hypothetical protein [Deltaproteobacteria bacterium]